MEYECKFPNDWVELMYHCNGFELEQCKIYGLDDARQIITDDSELWVIVEGYESKLLCVDVGKNDGHLYCIDFAVDDYEFTDYGETLSGALLKYLQR